MRVFTQCTSVVLSFLAAFLLAPRAINPARPSHPITGTSGMNGTTGSASAREAEPSGALEALEFWTRARAYPDADIAPAKFYKAYADSRRLLGKRAPSSLTAGSLWEPIGPVNLQGRTISVAFNPLNGNTVYVGSASGGLWRSYTGGLAGDWQRVVTGYPVLGVGAIAIDPADSNTMYIGTGEVYRSHGALGGLVIRTTRGSYGIGILKTTDGGSTWTKTLDWSFNEERGVQAIRINPHNRRTVLAATTEGIYKTTDGGQTWYATLGAPMAEDIIINPTDTTLVLATCGNFSSVDAGLYISFDTGESWFAVGGFPAFSGKALLESYAHNPNTVYASVADSTTGVSSLWRSTDFGGSWTQISSMDVAGLQGWYSHFVAVKPDDSTRIVRAGVGIYYSTNGGVSLIGSAGSYSDHHSYAHHPTDPNTLYIVNDDGVYRSTDFGITFSNVGFGMQTGQFYNGFSNSTSDSLLAIVQSQDHIPGYKYTGSLLWSRSALDECGWTAINPKNDRTMFAVNRNGGTVGKSTDRGNSFGGVFSSGSAGSWNTPIIMSPSDTNVIYLGKDLVYKSTGAGTGWFQTSSSGFLDGNLSLSMAISFTSPDTLYVGKAPLGARSHVFRTTNGGVAWTDVTGTLPDRYPMDLAVDPSNSRIVYAAFAGSNVGHVFKSTNAGGSWSDITGTLPDIPTTAVLVDPTDGNIVYAGNDIGVYVSTNAGGSWDNISEGLPDAVLISSLSFSPSNRMLRAATHGNGVYQRRMPIAVHAITVMSPNGGELWDATTIHPITWTETPQTPVRIQYSTDNGASWLPVADSVYSLTGSYSWHVPYTPSSQARVRVTALADTSFHDRSDGVFSITFHGSVVSLGTGWNLISLPVKVADPRKSTLFPTASSPAFDYLGSYHVRDTLKNGPGYWLRSSSSQSVPILGDSIVAETLAVAADWNLIGSISSSVPVSAITSSPPGIIVSRYFGYAAGYYTLTSVDPGQGCWVKTSAGGQLIVAHAAAGQSPVAARRLAEVNDLSSLSELTFSDASGSKQSLYFGINAPGTDAAGIDAARYEMPPIPPAGVFDARFATQRMVELFDGKKSAEVPILVSGGNGALSIGWHIRQTSATLVVDGKAISLSGDGSDQLAGDHSAENAMPRIRLTLSPAQVAETPKEFSLEQNYPNPFNPMTEVRYEVPVQSRVLLTVYDLLGREVATLVDEVIPAGRHSARWDASGAPSGIYFYRLTAGSFTGTKKMALVR